MQYIVCKAPTYNVCFNFNVDCEQIFSIVENKTKQRASISTTLSSLMTHKLAMQKTEASNATLPHTIMMFSEMQNKLHTNISMYQRKRRIQMK